MTERPDSLVKAELHDALQDTATEIENKIELLRRKIDILNLAAKDLEDMNAPMSKDEFLKSISGAETLARDMFLNESRLEEFHIRLKRLSAEFLATALAKGQTSGS